MKDANWKQKYLELRRRFVSSMDMAFRAGYEQGASEAQLESMQQQVAQAQQAQASAESQLSQGDEQQALADQQQAPEGQQEAPQEGQEGQEGMEPQAPNDQELDQHIAELESLVSKSEDLKKSADLKKSIEKIKNFRSSAELAKSLKSFGKISILPKKIPARASANLGSQGKNSVALQEKIVNDLLSKWESEASSASSDIMRAIGTEALTKKEG